ncbi:MAG TPA: secondary thiamine-phosphate synthase enzyme YjbQ [Candidatus Dormibacteraeota bacterium]
MIRSSRLRFASGGATDFVDVTSMLQDAVAAAGLRTGRLHIQSLHTTLAVTVNENEPLLLADFEALLDRLAPRNVDYLHDDFARRIDIPPDEPINGHAHCRQLLLQPSLTLLVEEGRLLLGRWQSVFAVELDGPRQRELALQLEGDAGLPAAAGGQDRELIRLELARQLLVDPELIVEPMRRLVESGGKRLRPLLVMLAARVGPRFDALRAAVLAAAVELIHNATLVHDDYVDESAVRHGAATVAAAEGAARAVAVGDYYFAKGTRLIAELGNTAVSRTIARAMEAICRSQIDDLALRGRYPGDRDGYLEVVQGKTAALISASCVSGAQLSGASSTVVERLGRYGELIGIAFQMADDVVDFSDSSGKPLGQDIRMRTVSLPLIYASEDRAAGPEVRRLLAGSPREEDIPRVVELVVGCGAVERATGEARLLAERAVGELELLDGELDGVRSHLVGLATAAVDRLV